MSLLAMEAFASIEEDMQDDFLILILGDCDLASGEADSFRWLLTLELNLSPLLPPCDIRCY